MLVIIIVLALLALLIASTYSASVRKAVDWTVRRALVVLYLLCVFVPVALAAIASAIAGAVFSEIGKVLTGFFRTLNNRTGPAVMSKAQSFLNQP